PRSARSLCPRSCAHCGRLRGLRTGSVRRIVLGRGDGGRPRSRGLLRRNEQLAVDLGTANTVVFRRGEGVVLFEPSVVALDERSERIVAVGTDARRMIGRTPAHIRAT